MLAIPAWKAELLEKRKNEKSKKKTDEVPEWKRELLKRLHNKAEAAKLRVVEKHKLNASKSVVDDHIDKVSENKFMREEQKLKMTSPTKHSPVREFPPPLSTPGLHIIRTEKMIIIEKEIPDDLQEITEQSHEELVKDIELPEAGIVSRLKVKFKKEKTQIDPVTSVDQRSNSMEESDSNHVDNKADDDDVIISPRSPAHPRSKSFPHPSYPVVKPPKVKSKEEQFQRKQSLDFFTPKSFHNSNSADFFQKVTSPTYKKVAAPVSPYKKVQPPVKKEGSVDLSTLHAPGQKTLPYEPEKPVHTAKSLPKTAPVKEDSTAMLHSGSYSFDKPKTPLRKADSSVTELDSVKLRKTKPQYKAQPVTKKEHSLAKTSTVDSINMSKKADEKTLKPTPAINKENIPIIPPRKKRSTPPTSPKISVEDLIEPKLIIPKSKIEPVRLKPAIEPKITTKEEKPKKFNNSSLKDTEKPRNSVMPSKIEPKKSQTQAKSKTTNAIKENTGNSKIINLGQISLDPSTITNKKAQALNEIMKESKTIQIIPSGKSPQASPANYAQDKPVVEKSSKIDPEPKKPSVSKEELRIMEEIKAMQALLDQAEKNGYVNHKKQENSIPKKEGKPDKTKTVAKVTNAAPVSSIDDIIDANETLIIPSKTVENYEKTTAVQESTVIAKLEKKPNYSEKSKNDTGSFFGTKLKSNSKGFGGFVIDPKKFGNSAAPSTTPATKKSITINPAKMANTFVVKPTAASLSNNPDKPASKGRRKPTADQIEVIGGYVKLEHSCLAKKIKTKKVSVDFSSTVQKHSYPSERSQLDEDSSNNLLKHPGTGKESQLGKYTPKYLLSMKEGIDDNPNSNNNSNNFRDEEEEEDGDMEYRDATPLENAEAFSLSSSDDILF